MTPRDLRKKISLLSLKSKMTIAVSFLVTFLLILMAFITFEYFERVIKESISQQQNAMVKAVAEQIDDKIDSARMELIAVAAIIPKDIVSHPSQAQSLLESRLDTRAIFDNGIYLFSPEGKLVAGTGMEPGMKAKDFSYRDYIKQTIASGKPFISEPFVSIQQHRHPVIMFTAPIIDHKGTITGIIGGSLDLLNDNFLGGLASIRMGSNGYLYLYNTNRTMIIHKDRTRILKRDVKPGANKMYDKALAGFEGTGETVNSKGIPVLSSFKRLKNMSWILAANYPVADAYKPVVTAKHYFIFVLSAMVVASILVIWFFMQHLTAPLLLFTNHVRRIADKVENNLTPIEINTNDEISTLAKAFNHMLLEVGKQRMAVQRQLEFLQVLIDTLPTPVFYKDSAGKYLGCNKPFSAFFGVAPEHIVGKTVFDIAPPDLAKMFYQADAQIFEKPGVQIYETTLLHVNGDRHNVVVYKGTFSNPDGTLGGLVGTFLDITDRKRAEAEVQEQQKFSESLLQNSSVATFVINCNHEVIFWNRACEELTGVRKDNIVGTKNQWQAFYALQRPVLADLIIDGATGKTREFYAQFTESSIIPGTIQAEGWYRNLQGTELYLLFHAAPIKNSAGQVVAVIQTLHDLTDRKRAEEDLREQQALLSNVIALIPHGIFWKDRNSTYLGCNENFALDAGLPTPAAIIGKNDRDLPWTKEQADFFIQCDHQVMESAKPLLDIEEKQLQAGGQEATLLTSKVPLTDHSGKVIGVLGIYSDITQRKRSEEEMKHTLSLLAATLESTADGLLVVDRSGHVSSYNGKFLQMWQISPELLKTQNIYEIVSFAAEQLREPQIFRTGVDTLNSDAEEESFKLLNFRDGRIFEWFSKPQKIDEIIVGRVWSFRDITEQHRLENQLRHSQKMEAIGTLAGGIAHDFNNILTATIGYAGLLELSLSHDDKLLHYVKQIIAVSERATTLTQSMLAYSRKQITNLCLMDLNEAVARMSKMLARLIREDIDLSLKNHSEKLIIMADTLQIEQVLMNLATNARDAMHNGGRLYISTERVTLDDNFFKHHGFGTPGAYALLSVSDNGCGMDEETSKRIFEPFFTTKEVGKGTGLGLSIVYGIIKKHNGFIICSSEQGKGTCFKIYLPLADEMSENPEAHLPVTSSHTGKRSGTVLLAEDDTITRLLTRDLLEEIGYNVLMAADGDEALAVFKENRHQIELVMLDVIMPKKKGKEVYDEICACSPATPTIFISGYTADVIHKHGYLDKSLHFLPKPYTANTLLSKIIEVTKA